MSMVIRVLSSSRGVIGSIVRFFAFAILSGVSPDRGFLIDVCCGDGGLVCLTGDFLEVLTIVNFSSYGFTCSARW